MRKSIARLWATLIIMVACPDVFCQSWFTLIDDDAGNIEAISAIKDIADKHGIKMCFGVIANDVLRKPDVAKNLLKFQKEGHQICNHSLSHDAQVWKRPAPNSVEKEFERSEEILDSLGFNSHNYLIYPWGRFDTVTRSWLLALSSKYFSLAFDSRGEVCNLKNYNRYYIHRLPLRKHDNISIIKHEIDKAVETDTTWIIFLTHSAMKRDFSADYISEVIDYCQAKGLKNVTVEEAYNLLRVQNKLMEGGTEDWTYIDEIMDVLYKHLICLVVAVVCILSIFMTIVFYKFKIQ